MQYTETSLLNTFYGDANKKNETEPGKETPSDDQKILFENKLLGVPRIRQVNVDNFKKNLI